MELRMSGKERDRLKVMAAVAARRLRQGEAARLVALSERQVRRILVRYRTEGDAGLVHRGRGRPSKRDMAALRKAGLVRFVGHARTGQYRLMGRSTP
jgi:transposase